MLISNKLVRIIWAKCIKVLDKSIKTLPPTTEVKTQKVEFDRLDKKVPFNCTMPVRKSHLNIQVN